MAEMDLSPPQQAIRLLMGFIAARAVYAAAKLGLADAIPAEGVSAGRLAAQIGADPSGLERLLRALSGLGVVMLGESGRYRLTPRGETLRKDSPQSIRDYAIYVHEFLYDLFEDLVPGVCGGNPIVEAKLGAPLFAYLQQHPDKAALFHAGLANRGRVEAPAILEASSFAGCRKIVDLGGGNGAFLSAILAAYPEASGVLLERGAAIASARRGEGGPLPRCALVEGDYFNAVPAGGDVYVLKRVLFDHTAGEVVQILRRCRDAMAPQGKVVIIEGLAGAPNEPSLAHLMDLTFLLATTGRMRTEAEYKNLLQQAGLRLDKCLATRADVSVLEAARA
ncbi:MAG TPA: methyltransferase [Stellaceae bacterium]|nr:methyltransferase [Stellaceae bacterium]